MILKSDGKLKEKVTSGLENDTRNLKKFYQSIQKSQNCEFDGILLSKSKSRMNLTFT